MRPFLYIKLSIAYIKGVIIAVAVGFFVLIFPFYNTIYSSYSSGQKKLSFNLSVFCFNLLGGEIRFSLKGVKIFLSKGKKILIPLKKLTTIKGSVKPLKDYKIYSMKSYVNVGECKNTAKTFGAVSIANTLLLSLNVFSLQKKGRKFIDNKISYSEGENGVNITAKAVVIVNLLMIFITLIKILLRKIFNGNK